MLVLGLTSSDLMNGEGGSTHYTFSFFFFFSLKEVRYIIPEDEI